MGNYLENLPPELQREIAMKRRIGVKEYADLLGLSIWQARRLWAAGKIPAPEKVGQRKLSIPMGIALRAAEMKAAA